MKFRRNSNQFISIIVLFLVLLIGVGYAYLSSNLSITGSTNVVGNTWDIHFANLQVADGSVDAVTPATIDTNDNTLINYSVKLNRPGDYYEFTVDMVNSGTLPGKLTLVELNGITSAVEDVIDYSIVYTNNNSPVAVNDILNAQSSKNIKVRVYYKEDISEGDLLTSNTNLTITFNITFNQSDKSEVTTNTIVQQLKTENSSCFTKYEGQVTDQVGQTVGANNVYFNKCADKRNIIFGGFCWQMIRTTETGGIKMIYNGEPDQNGKCGSSRGTHKGIVGTNSSTQNLSAEYLYGTTFTYNTTTNEFTLVDTFTATWSDSTYTSLLGKFTCKNTSGICTTLYSVNGYSNATTAYTASYTTGDTNYAQIGTSVFNANYKSPAMVGYMFNKVYNSTKGDPTSGSLTGNDVSYSNGTYTLLPADGESELGTTIDNTHHYTCNTTSSTCSKVRFYTFGDYYIELDGEQNIDEAVNEMLYSNDVNTYNSSIKGIIDSWYAQNLSSKTNMLEDAIFCNARNVINPTLNEWNKNGNMYTPMKFKDFSALNNDISCTNETDQFAVSNNKAKLTYPASLATQEELYTLADNTTYYSTLIDTGDWWWGLSPYDFSQGTALVWCVTTTDDYFYCGYNVSIANGVRLVVSLAPGNVISSGDGSETRPWIIG